jgi:hypothetical protein
MRSTGSGGAHRLHEAETQGLEIVFAQKFHRHGTAQGRKPRSPALPGRLAEPEGLRLLRQRLEIRRRRTAAGSKCRRCACRRCRSGRGRAGGSCRRLLLGLLLGGGSGLLGLLGLLGLGRRRQLDLLGRRLARRDRSVAHEVEHETRAGPEMAQADIFGEREIERRALAVAGGAYVGNRTAQPCRELRGIERHG